MPTRSSSSTRATSCRPDPWSTRSTCCSTARERASDMKHALAACAVLLAASTALLAQRPSGFPGSERPAAPREPQQPSGPPVPTFRVQVDAIEIEAFVTDEQGKPVTGLKREDFQIFEDGKRQNITSFSQVDIPFEPRAGARNLSAAAEPDVVANDHSDGRVYMFALDEVPPDAALRARVFLKRFLERHFAANDRGAVVFLGRQNSMAGQTFTNDPRLLLAAVERYIGGVSAENVPISVAVEDPAPPAVQATGGIPAGVTAARKKLIESYKTAQRAQVGVTALGTMSGLEAAVNAIASLKGRRK